MATLCATLHYPLSKAFYQHLRDKGKPAKVALAAVIRKLLVDSLFNRIKGYRAIATRYDKLATMFLGGALATLLAVSLNGIVNTPLRAPAIRRR